MKPFLLRRIRNRLTRNIWVYALRAWLLWALAALLLFSLVPEHGLLLAMLLLGAVILYINAKTSERLRRDLTRQRHWEAQRQHDFNWRLRAKMQPRQDLPLWISYMAQPEVLDAAWRLITEERPQRALELGSGISTLVMAYALESNGGGKLVALEDHPNHVAKSSRLLEEHGLSEIARVIHAPFTPLKLDVTPDKQTSHWYSLDGLPTDAPFDFVFVDGPGAFLDPNIRYPAMPLLRQYLADGAVILLDDMDRPPEQRIVQRWLDEFPELEIDYAHSGSLHTTLRVKKRER